MNNLPIPLKVADRIEILTVIDNYMDLLLGNTDVVTRPRLIKEGKIVTDTLVAEHGLALIVTVYQGTDKHSIMLDAGYSSIGVSHNIAQLEIDLEYIEAVVLSHGHIDHLSSLYNILDRAPEAVPVVVHPDAFLPRYGSDDDGNRFSISSVLTREALTRRNIEIIESERPQLLVNDLILVTGEVERCTSFEKGIPHALIEKDGQLEKDTLLDDQALVMNLDGKGLVVVSGCCHSGIINTSAYAKKITGVEDIHAVIGGFHLSGPKFKPIIEESIDELKKMNPQVVVPMHCTGWETTVRFSKAFPSAFVLNSVGSTITMCS